jgi:hypothetical protein
MEPKESIENYKLVKIIPRYINMVLPLSTELEFLEN